MRREGNEGILLLLDLVAVMHRAFRRDDWIVRPGGDEFQVFIPDCPERRVLALSKSLSAQLSLSRIGVSDTETIVFGASIGYAFTTEPGQPATRLLQNLIDAADADMYAHKGARGQIS